MMLFSPNKKIFRPKFCLFPVYEGLPMIGTKGKP